MIQCEKLTKKFISYKKEPGLKGSLKSLFYNKPITKKAVDSFHMSIHKGEFVGLLGPNGSGKTTLMKMMTGIIMPTEGDLQVLGYTPCERRKDFRKKISLVMGQKSQLWWDIPAMDSLCLIQKYYEIEPKDFQKRINELSEILNVRELLHIHVRKLSLGERMKLELMSSLLHKPEIIFLDEPTIGLDLVAQRNIRKFLMDYQTNNPCTILLTSHYMADVEALCKRIVLVINGRNVFDGSIQDFQYILGSEKSVTFHFSKSIDPSETIFKSLHSEWSHQNKQVDLKINESQLREISKEILNKFPVINFNSEKMPIERVMNSLITNPEILKNFSKKRSEHNTKYDKNN